MTLGIPLGFGVIVFTVIITAIYVRRANSEFDDLTSRNHQGGAEMSRRNILLALAALRRWPPARPAPPVPTSARPRSRPPTGRPSACSASSW